MARRAKKKQEVSLFPFLDILACVIGNLILIITAVVLEQVDTKPVADAAEYEAKLVKVKEQEQQIEKLERELEELRMETASTSVELEKIEEQVEAAEEKLREARSQVAKIPKTPPKIDPALLQEKKLLEDKLRELEAEATKIKAGAVDLTVARQDCRSCGRRAIEGGVCRGQQRWPRHLPRPAAVA
jgi:predicted RNase H-like nuclease (RuvC/YqgF family)